MFGFHFFLYIYIYNLLRHQTRRSITPCDRPLKSLETQAAVRTQPQPELSPSCGDAQGKAAALAAQGRA